MSRALTDLSPLLTTISTTCPSIPDYTVNKSLNFETHKLASRRSDFSNNDAEALLTLYLLIGAHFDDH